VITGSVGAADDELSGSGVDSTLGSVARDADTDGVALGLAFARVVVRVVAPSFVAFGAGLVMTLAQPLTVSLPLLWGLAPPDAFVERDDSFPVSAFVFPESVPGCFPLAGADFRTVLGVPPCSFLVFLAAGDVDPLGFAFAVLAPVPSSPGAAAAGPVSPIASTTPAAITAAAMGRGRNSSPGHRLSPREPILTPAPPYAPQCR
jgi:hypothetical protein